MVFEAGTWPLVVSGAGASFSGSVTVDVSQLDITDGFTLQLVESGRWPHPDHDHETPHSY